MDVGPGPSGDAAPASDARDAVSSSDAPAVDAPSSSDVTSADATASDAVAPADAACTRPMISTASVGADCEATRMCPAGNVCHPMNGVRLAYECVILCAVDCDCPQGFACVDTADKVSRWRECRAIR